MKIAFWSPLHGTGTTAGLAAAVLAASKETDKRILMTQTHFNLNDLERPLISGLEGSNRDDFFMNMGIDAVIKYYKAGDLTRDILESCVFNISDRVSLLSGTRQTSRSAYDNGIVNKIIAHVYEVAEQYYDLLVIDTNAGYSASSLMTLESSDIIVVNLRQNRHMLDELFSNKVFMSFDPDRIFYIFGSYDPDSKYNLHNIRRLYKPVNSSNSEGIPHCTAYMDALSEKRTIRFIDFCLSEKDTVNGDFASSLKDLSKKLRVMVGKAGRTA